MTSSAAHTAGPWTIRDGSFIDGPGFTCLATVRAAHVAHEPEAIANARLIAAAPDGHKANRLMVKALIEEYRIPADASDDWIYDTLGSCLGNAFILARAAIAKAKGAA